MRREMTPTPRLESLGYKSGVAALSVQRRAGEDMIQRQTRLRDALIEVVIEEGLYDVLVSRQPVLPDVTVGCELVTQQLSAAQRNRVAGAVADGVYVCLLA